MIIYLPNYMFVHSRVRPSENESTKHLKEARAALMDGFMILVLLLFEGAAGLINVTVEPGQDVILNCHVSRTSDVRAVEWIKQGEPSKNILFYSDDRFDPEDQHASFSGRVNLADLELKDGDVSLILKNVSAEDNGRYECLVATGGARRTKRSVIKGPPVEVFQLVVKGSQNENSINENSINENSINENSINENSINEVMTRLVFVGGAAAVSLLLLTVGGLVVNKRRLQKKNPVNEVEVEPLSVHVPEPSESVNT
ncbi:putative butyrophilin subfamily 2 member A3 [Anoplopoma fimbria]|uniref:putative butyrophilin subfamily 2 member A3 n=1 Tax=Anoplopoma fimbria TaxID=229290 RepID=UPI0023EDD5A9|nr:putative butyrophilin subfamily 2 member A3 [Anoplopoma fimbria]